MDKIYALDFGTNGITVAEYSNDYMKSKTLRNKDGDEITPAIFVDGPIWSSQKYGKEAKEGQAIYQCITSAKTKVGEKEAYTAEGVKYKPSYVIKNTASHVLDEIEESNNISIRNIVLTYPAHMKYQRFDMVGGYGKLFEENTKPGGVNRNVMLTISEPEAAAMAYWNPDMGDQKILVFDCGGGTTDLCIVIFKTINGVRHVLTRHVYGVVLGGDNWDQFLKEFFVKQMKEQGISYEKDIKLLKELNLKCEEIKIHMSTRRDAKVEFYLFSNHNNKYVHFVISKAEYQMIYKRFWEEMKNLLNDYTIRIDREKKGAADIGTTQIDKVLLVGGTCSNVILQQHLKEYFSQTAYPNVKVIAHKEKTAVAIGAANYAHWVLDKHESIQLEGLSGNDAKVEVELECSDSLGVRCISEAGTYHIGNVIRRGNTFPCEGKRVFGIQYDNQQAVCLPIYWNESENKNAKMEESTWIGEIEMDLSRFQTKKDQRVEVKIRMPSQGIVHVEGNYEGKIRVPGKFEFIRQEGA